MTGCYIYMVFDDLYDLIFFFFFNDTATTEIYTLSLHDALPIWTDAGAHLQLLRGLSRGRGRQRRVLQTLPEALPAPRRRLLRSEEHTSELQSRQYLVCRLLLEKKNK